MTEASKREPEATQPSGDVSDIAPDFGKFVSEFVFGQVWSRPGLEARIRSLCTVAALTALGGRELQLRAHLHSALRNGATKQEIVEVLLQMAVYAGFPASWNGLIAAKQVFAEYDQAAAAPEGR